MTQPPKKTPTGITMAMIMDTRMKAFVNAPDRSLTGRPASRSPPSAAGRPPRAVPEPGTAGNPAYLYPSNMAAGGASALPHRADITRNRAPPTLSPHRRRAGRRRRRRTPGLTDQRRPSSKARAASRAASVTVSPDNIRATSSMRSPGANGTTRLKVTPASTCFATRQ